jgi:hypothetical protein
VSVPSTLLPDPLMNGLSTAEDEAYPRVGCQSRERRAVAQLQSKSNQARESFDNWSTQSSEGRQLDSYGPSTVEHAERLRPTSKGDDLPDKAKHGSHTRDSCYTIVEKTTLSPLVGTPPQFRCLYLIRLHGSPRIRSAPDEVGLLANARRATLPIGQGRESRNWGVAV